MVLCSLTWVIAFAHPGRTDSSGGHWVRTEGWGYEVGTYHYHNGGSSSGQSSSSSASSSYSYPFIKETEPKSDEPEEKTYIPTNDIQVSEIPEISSNVNISETTEEASDVQIAETTEPPSDSEAISDVSLEYIETKKNAEAKPKIKKEVETEFSGFDFLEDWEPTYNYSKARKVYEENNNPDKSGWDDFWLLLCLYAFIIVFGGFVIWLRQKPIIDVPPKKDKLPNKLNVIDEYQLVQAIKEDNNKLFEALSEKQQALIPEGTAIDENGLPHLVNRQYGYGRLYNAFVTKSGNHYHRSRCPEILGHKKKCIHRYDAIKSYQPCLRCKPLRHVDDWYLEYIEIEKTKNNIRQK